MPIFAETEDKIFGDILYDVVNNTNITRASPGSKTRALAQAVSKKMGRMWKQFDRNMVQTFLNGATGRYLDFLGAMMGVARLGEETATATAAQKLVRFYVDVGTFGDINGGSSITVPSGTIISTAKNEGGIKYTTPYTVILPSDQSQQYIPVTASVSGSRQNVAAKTLTYHNFTDYVQAFNETLQVTNEADITTGREIENDTNYRYRIANQVVSSEQANMSAIRIAALVVPGVADAVVIPYFRGIGTYDVLIKATTPSVPDTLLAAVFENIWSSTAQGIMLHVRGPVEIGVSLKATLKLRKPLSSREETNLVRAVITNVSSYIDNLDIADSLVLQEIVERIMTTSDLIKGVGTLSKPLDNVYIHRPTRLEDNKVRSTLLQDYDADSDEKLLVENRYAGRTPINILVAS